MIKGSLQINKGIYYVSFRVPDGKGGQKQRMKTTGIKAVKGNKKQAEQKMREILEKYDSINYFDSEILLCDYIQNWIERNKNNIQPTTYDGYVHMLKKHIYPYFKAIKLKVIDVKALHLETYYNEKINSGLSPKTVRHHHRLISPVLQDALKNELIKFNPASVAKVPKVKQKEMEYYTIDELKQLLTVSKGTTLEVPIYFAVMFGLRRSEIIGLCWKDVDFDNKTLTICRKVTRNKVDGKWVDVVSEEMKTETSKQTYPLNDDNIAYLEAVKEKQDHYIRTTQEYKEFICVNEIGERIKLDYFTSKFEKILKQNNLQHIRLHDLRHSCLTALVANGIPMKVVQQYARHANYTTTANIYTHVDNKQILEALNVMTQLLTS